MRMVSGALAAVVLAGAAIARTPDYSNDLFGVIKLDGKCEVLTPLK